MCKIEPYGSCIYRKNREIYKGEEIFSFLFLLFFLSTTTFVTLKDRTNGMFLLLTMERWLRLFAFYQLFQLNDPG